MTLSVTAISAAKKTSSAAAQQSNENCDDRLPMSALDCCAMPRFINEVIITGCRAKVMANRPPRSNNGTFDGPPPEFFDCLVETTGMCTIKTGNSLVVDQTKATKYLQSQLNDTTKKDWNDAVSNGCSTCIKAYKKDNLSKTFLDCLIKEFYTVRVIFCKTNIFNVFRTFVHRNVQVSRRMELAKNICLT